MFSRAHLAVLLAAVVFSTGGAAIKACQLAPWQVAGFRSGIAAVVLAALVVRARQVSGPILLVAVAYAATLVSFVIANKLTTAAHAVFLQAAAPMYVLALERTLPGVRFDWRDLPVMALVIAGLALLLAGTGAGTATAPDPSRGNQIAVMSGLFYACMLVGLRWLTSLHSDRPGAAEAATLWGNVLAFLVCLPMALPVAGARVADWLVLGYLGAIQIALAYYLLTRAVRTVSALDVSLLLLLEPVLNPIWAWWLQGEQPGRWAIVGGALVLCATAWRSVRRDRAQVIDGTGLRPGPDPVPNRTTGVDGI
jgi:drug/metabolite transporter (DMT)-like permease